jgi:hypothetical protein
LRMSPFPPIADVCSAERRYRRTAGKRLNGATPSTTHDKSSPASGGFSRKAGLSFNADFNAPEREHASAGLPRLAAVAVWIAFSALATFAQWALTALALLTPMMAATSAIFGGIVLVAVGLYQWTPLKNTCLRACHAPLGFLMAHGGFRNEPLGAFRLGLAHGAYCLGCCFALMALTSYWEVRPIGSRSA